MGVRNGNYIMPEESADKVTVKEAFSGLPTVKNGANRLFWEKKNGEISKYASQLKSRNSGGCENNLVTRNSETVLQRYRHIPQGGNREVIPPY